MSFLGKLIGGKGENMSAVNQPDLAELQRQRDKHQAALSGVSEKIAAIEEEVRLKREERERKERELAKLQKRLAACQSVISWTEKHIAELNETVRGQAGLMLDGNSEGFFTVKSGFQEIAGWERELALFKEFEISIPKEIEKLTATL